MSMKLVNIHILSFVLIVSLSMATNYNYKPGDINNNSFQLTGEDYMTGEDGVARMSVNIWGHVKYPGTYLVYDEIDILTCLSMAGGPLKGAKTSEILIISRDGKTQVIDLNQNHSIKLDLKPYDTIKVDEKASHVLLTKTSLISVILQLINVILTASN